MTVEELYNMVSFCVERGDDGFSVSTAEDAKTICEALSLLKKQKPMKPSWDCGRAYCPNCRQKLPRKHHEYERNYCSNCGQAVIWNDK